MSGRLGNLRMAAFAAPGIGLSLFYAPFPAIIAAFYATHTAVTTAAIATVLLLVRVSDAFIDVGIGYASDMTRSPFGRRKPWIAAGAFLAIPACGLLFNPPETSGVLYFAFGMAAYYLTLGITDIPLRSWIGELTNEYAERSRFAAWLTFTVLVGSMVFLLLPELLNSIGVVPTSRIDARIMSIYGACGMIVLPLGIMLAVWFLPAGKARGAPVRAGVFDMFRAMRTNRPFQILLGAEVATQIAWGVTYALIFIAFETYFGLAETAALILVGATLAQIGCVPIISLISRRVDRHLLWGWSSILSALLTPGVLLFKEDTPEQFVPMAIFVAVLSAFGTAQMMFPAPMVNDAADYDTFRTGAHRNGMLYSLRLLTYKASFAIGNAVGFYMLAIVGYDPRSLENSDSASMGMLLTFTLVPGLFFLIAGALLLFFPITRRRHAVITRWLNRRERMAGNAEANQA